MREPIIRRFYELASDGTVERAYVHCQMDPCSDSTTRTIVDTETDSEIWAQRHMREYHGLDKYQFQGLWPYKEEERAWKKAEHNLEIAWEVLSGNETLEDVIEDYGLTDQEAEWLAEIVWMDSRSTEIRRAGLIALLREGPHTLGAIEEKMGYKPVATLGKLKKEGRIKNESGFWSLIKEPEPDLLV